MQSNLLTMEYIGLLYNPLTDDSVQLSLELQTHLQQRGVNVWRGTSHDIFQNPAALIGVDLLIAMGGDGTVLRATRIAIPHGIPILTVAMGRLNFMAELTPETMYEGLDMLLERGGWLDQRSLIQVVLHRNGEAVAVFTALNEAVISRGDISRIVTVEVLLDNIPLTTYRADGVLVATATGSSAYALSAGGPIVDPRSRALILVPVAAHLTAIPAMVLHEDTVVSLRVACCRHATLAVDGRENIAVAEGDEICISRSSKICTFVRVYPHTHFYASLVNRLRRE
jgi:NAD+ kinase